jgi:hypothetical protein
MFYAFSNNMLVCQSYIAPYNYLGATPNDSSQNCRSYRYDKKFQAVIRGLQGKTSPILQHSTSVSAQSA